MKFKKMKNKKAQQVSSGVVVVLLVIIVFSIGFITESMDVSVMEAPVKSFEKSTGLKAVSGMVVLGSVLDTVAEGETELAISIKDGDFYLIEKKKGYWHYKYTNMKVDSDNMDKGFNYYKVSEIPEGFEVKTGNPFYNSITGMAVGVNMAGGILG